MKVKRPETVEIKIKPKAEVDRERLEENVRRDSISLLKNLIRLHPKEAKDEVRKLKPKTT